MNQSSTEIVAAIRSVIAWGRASCESLNLILNSPVLRRKFGPYSSATGINAQWTREVPEAIHRLRRLLCNRWMVLVSLIISRLPPRLALQADVRDRDPLLKRFAHVVDRQGRD